MKSSISVDFCLSWGHDSINIPKQVAPKYFTSGFVGSVGLGHPLLRRRAGWHTACLPNITRIICRRFEYQFGSAPDQLWLIPLFHHVFLFSFGAGKNGSNLFLHIVGNIALPDMICIHNTVCLTYFFSSVEKKLKSADFLYKLCQWSLFFEVKKETTCAVVSLYTLVLVFFRS